MLEPNLNCIKYYMIVNNLVNEMRSEIDGYNASVWAGSFGSNRMKVRFNAMQIRAGLTPIDNR
jgi:hypothetical protein